MDWNYNRVWGTITGFPGGGEVFLQGEEAAELDDRIEACETDEQIESILMEYEHIAE
jgi:hypothetical protein